MKTKSKWQGLDPVLFSLCAFPREREKGLMGFNFKLKSHTDRKELQGENVVTPTAPSQHCTCYIYETLMRLPYLSPLKH